MTKTPVIKKAPRKRVQRHAPEVRRELLLQAARKCLSKKGGKGFTLQNVAKEAKVSLGLINHYFGSIDDLLQAVFSSVMFSPPEVTHEEAQGPDTALNELRDLIARNFAPDYYSRGNLLIWLPIYEEMMLNEKLRRTLVKKDQEYVDKVAASIAKVAKHRKLSINAQHLAYDFLSLLDGLWVRWCHSEREDTGYEQDAAINFLEAKLGPIRAGK